MSNDNNTIIPDDIISTINDFKSIFFPYILLNLIKLPKLAGFSFDFQS